MRRSINPQRLLFLSAEAKLHLPLQILQDYVMLVLPYSDEQLTLVLPRGGAWWSEINEA